jgi:hypothetical protein
MIKKFSTLAILLASFSLIACGGSSKVNTTETLNDEVVGDETENDTQSANGIWGGTSSAPKA